MTARIIMKLVVDQRDRLAPDVAQFWFRHPSRPLLPPWTPGAHVDLRLPDGKIRQYSLTSDPADLSRYAITVKREDDGRGGSQWLHQNATTGHIAHVSAPRNNFPLSDGRAVLIAGGIGVTPMHSMARQLAADGRLVEAHICERARPSTFETKLRAICGDALQMHISSDGANSRLNVAQLVSRLPRDVHIYCCGPDRLISAVQEAAADWPEPQVHFERFGAVVDENFEPEPFDITIASTGKTYRVPEDRSALEILREAGHVLPSSCELGVCGSCECAYVDGTVIHRDSVLSQTARESKMMLCVSRARVAVTVDL